MAERLLRLFAKQRPGLIPCVGSSPTTSAIYKMKDYYKLIGQSVKEYSDALNSGNFYHASLWWLFKDYRRGSDCSIGHLVYYHNPNIQEYKLIYPGCSERKRNEV